MKPVYVATHIKYDNGEEIITRFELPFEEPVPLDSLKKQLEKKLSLPALKFDFQSGDKYYYCYKEEITKPFSDEVIDTVNETISVTLLLVLKIGSRYFLPPEIDLS